MNTRLIPETAGWAVYV